MHSSQFTAAVFLNILYISLPAFLEALPHLCQHVNLTGADSDSRAVLCTLIGLMEDSDPVVRTRFSQSVRFLLAETTRNSEQSSLNEVSNSGVKTPVFLIYYYNIILFLSGQIFTIFPLS